MNGGRRKEHTTVHLVNDSGRGAGKEVVREGVRGAGHDCDQLARLIGSTQGYGKELTVRGLNGSKDDHFGMDTLVTLLKELEYSAVHMDACYWAARRVEVYHHADSLGGIQSSVGLSNLIVEASLADHRDEDMVGLSGDLDTLGCHFAKDTEWC